MALGDGLRVGGVYLDVKLDTSGLPGQMQALKRETERLARQYGVGIPLGYSSGPGASGPAASPGSRPMGGGIAGIAGGASLGVSQQVVGTLKAIQSTHGNLLSQVAANTKILAGQAKFQLKAWNDARRMEVQGAAGSALRGRLNTVFGTRFNTDPSRAFAHLGADVRAAGGGFGLGGGLGHGPIAAPVAQASSAAARQVAQAATQAAQATAQQIVTKIGVTPAAAVAGARGVHLQRRRNGTVDWQASPYGGPREPSVAQATGMMLLPPGLGGMAMGLGRRLGFGGVARAGLLGGVAAGYGGAMAGAAGGIASGAAGLAPGALSALAGLAPALQAVGPAGLAATAAVLGFKNTLNLALAPGRAFGNVIRNVEEGAHRFAMSPLLRFSRGAVAAPFHLALAPMRLFSRGVDDSVRRVGALGTASKGLQLSLALPFRAALSPISLVVGQLGHMARLAAVVGPSLAAMGAYHAVRGAAEARMVGARAETAFGPAAERARAFADERAGRFGAGRRGTMETQAQLGLMFTGTGIAGDAAERMSRELTARAADMAAIFGRPIEDLKAAMQSALAGQMRPLRMFDTVLDAQMVKQKAVAMGLARTTDAVNGQARAMATYALIMQKTGQFQGGLAENMNQFNVLMAEIRGRFTNAADAIGERLLPAAREAALLITDLFAIGGGESAPILSALGAFGERLRDGIRTLRVFAANWRETLGVVAEVGRGIGRVFSGLTTWMMDAGRTFFGWFIENWQDLLADMGDAFTTFIGNFSQNVANLQKAIAGLAMGRGWDFKAVGLLEGFDPKAAPMPQMPGLDLGIQETMANINARLAGMMANALGLRGVDDQGGGRHHAAAFDAMAEEAGRSRRSMSGSMVSAEQLRELQNQSNFRDKQLSLLERIAQNTDWSPDELGKALAVAPSLVAIAAP